MAFDSRRGVLPFVGVVWLAAVGVGMHTLGAYTYTPGQAAAARVRWPPSTALTLDASRPTLLMFTHPKCPCSRASVAELGRLMVQAQGRLAVRVVVEHPAGTPEGWEHTDIWEAAAAIPGVSVVSDHDGREARLFDAIVSGQTFLYSDHGELLFAGGLTRGRGHEGDNAGRDAVHSWITTGGGAAHTPVFGCTLRQKLERATADDRSPQS
jgi:hypothetical protein